MYRSSNHVTSNQARSQDFEKGGLFWKSKKSAYDLDPNFHCSWISFTQFVRKLRRNFLESSEIQRFFPPKIRWSPKKKVFTEIETEFSAQIGNPNVWRGAVFLWGGYFQFFTKNRPQNHQKRAILHTSQANGGARAPPPPLATLLGLTHFTLNCMIKIILETFLIAPAHLIPCWLFFYLAAPLLFLLQNSRYLRNKCYQRQLVCTSKTNEWCKKLTMKTLGYVNAS